MYLDKVADGGAGGGEVCILCVLCINICVYVWGVNLYVHIQVCVLYSVSKWIFHLFTLQAALPLRLRQRAAAALCVVGWVGDRVKAMDDERVGSVDQKATNP